jgi:anti-anti-sigma factor
MPVTYHSTRFRNPGVDLAVAVGAVTFVDSTSFDAHVRARTDVLRSGGSLRLIPAPDCVRRPLEICGLAELFSDDQPAT